MSGFEASTVGPGWDMTEIDAQRTYLEMTMRPAEHRGLPDAACRLERVITCPPSFYRFLYAEVGRPWHWLDRLSWRDEMIKSHLDQQRLELWVLYCDGAPAGFAELKREDEGSVEIAYFGLLPEFLGRRLGGAFLSAVLDEAWRPGTRRVWLHTCTLDHPWALPNYLKRGFRVFREESYRARLAPERTSSISG
jgi:GNAT superfamily N-acetyltransferase